MMNSRQKEIVRLRYDSESKVLKDLQKSYISALEQINEKIKNLILKEDIQSKAYQLNYQKALKKQVETILNKLRRGTYTTLKEYLDDCYTSSFFQTLYDLQGQGIPLLFPIDQKAMVKAIQNDTKLSKSLYSRLGVDVKKLNDSIAFDITQGLATGRSYMDIARSVNQKMSIGMNNSIRIARTEGHRIQSEATFDCMKTAKDNGAKIYKQWDSTLDKRTRPDHVELDGQIRELEEPFTVNGFTAMYPAGFGVAEQDINCRCTLLQRAEWAIGEDETYSKWDGENGVLKKDLSGAESYEEFISQMNESME